MFICIKVTWIRSFKQNIWFAVMRSFLFICGGKFFCFVFFYFCVLSNFIKHEVCKEINWMSLSFLFFVFINQQVLLFYVCIIFFNFSFLYWENWWWFTVFMVCFSIILAFILQLKNKLWFKHKLVKKLKIDSFLFTFY